MFGAPKKQPFIKMAQLLQLGERRRRLANDCGRRLLDQQVADRGTTGERAADERGDDGERTAAPRPRRERQPDAGEIVHRAAPGSGRPRERPGHKPAR